MKVKDVIYFIGVGVASILAITQLSSSKASIREVDQIRCEVRDNKIEINTKLDRIEKKLDNYFLKFR